MSEAVAAHEQISAEAPSMPGVDNRKFGMWLFIASEVMFFTALIGMFIAYRGQPDIGSIKHETLTPSLPLVALNTFLLLTSSFTVVMAVSAAQRGAKRGLTIALALTALLGATFVTIQGIEYSKLIAELTQLSGQSAAASTNASIFASVFFMLTGFHGLHVVVGILWCLGVLVRAARGGFTQHNNLGVELFGLYWHFVDVVWIVLFTVIYLL
jgi:heme/copper-type cytochrome/quinol oxidase subunit 3